MDIGGLAPATTGGLQDATLGRVDGTTRILKKALDLEADQSSRLLQMVDAQKGLGQNLDTLA